MDYFTLRIIIGLVVVPIIAFIIRSSIQNNKNEELSKIKSKTPNLEDELESVTTLQPDDIVLNEKNHSLSKVKNESKFIDSYYHPNYHISAMAYLQIVLLWALLGLFFPYLFLYMMLQMQLVFFILTVVLLNIFFFWIYIKFINLNKNKVLIDLYNDKITFYTKDVFLFEIPQDKILDLQIIVETDAGTVWPNEYVFIHIEREHLETEVLPILLKIIKLEHLISFFKIKYKQETIVNLTGENNTSFIEEIVRLKY